MELEASDPNSQHPFAACSVAHFSYAEQETMTDFKARHAYTIGESMRSWPSTCSVLGAHEMIAAILDLMVG